MLDDPTIRRLRQILVKHAEGMTDVADYLEVMDNLPALLDAHAERPLLLAAKALADAVVLCDDLDEAGDDDALNDALQAEERADRAYRAAQAEAKEEGRE